jgi:hypothetical protein
LPLPHITACAEASLIKPDSLCNNCRLTKTEGKCDTREEQTFAVGAFAVS